MSGTRFRPVSVLVALVSLCASAFCDEIPLPVSRTTKLQRGTTYSVKGTQRIPRNTEIRSPLGTRIVGRGKGATLVVEGRLKANGTFQEPVVFENLRVVLDRRFDEVTLSWAIFVGTGGLRTESHNPALGKLTLSSVLFDDATTFEVDMVSGSIDFLYSGAANRVRIRHVTDKERPGRLTVNLLGCNRPWDAVTGLSGGLRIEGVPDVKIRLSNLAGERIEFVDCEVLLLDGNAMRAPEIVLSQTKAGRFKRTRILKCDFYCLKLEVISPPGSRRETITANKCWFGGVTSRKRVHDSVIEDAHDAPKKTGTAIVLRSLQPRKNKIGGTK